MKKLLFIPLLFVCFFSFAQAGKISCELGKDTFIGNGGTLIDIPNNSSRERFFYSNTSDELKVVCTCLDIKKHCFFKTQTFQGLLAKPAASPFWRGKITLSWVTKKIGWYVHVKFKA